ncbi:MAG TPA: aspartyl/asparaginyl beta-hydroxylase domain-containing protein [Cyanobacteria bacterium UBA8553]|nr:aspartyl/asparaginyl beta-hydroxylase domain-containing protein [Cyanobacteria bacterium UBA8553]HAJ63712.1 aspartyl/asparaginyl beta-hydroxylase domain-containing protein [Cyanobacteria bacterium UBA8543]
MFFDKHKFAFAEHLESNWLLIRQELEQLQETDFISWPEKFLYEKGWNVFGLYAFGKKLNYSCQLFPETTRLVEMIPGIVTAGFSSLRPGTHIKPHVGYSKAVLRCHLGLIVPEECTLRVGNETRNWQEGKCFIFDDTVEHEAWNRGDKTRIVLLIDFKNPSATLNHQSQMACPDEIAKFIRNLTHSTA